MPRSSTRSPRREPWPGFPLHPGPEGRETDLGRPTRCSIARSPSCRHRRLPLLLPTDGGPAHRRRRPRHCIAFECESPTTATTSGRRSRRRPIDDHRPEMGLPPGSSGLTGPLCIFSAGLRWPPTESPGTPGWGRRRRQSGAIERWRPSAWMVAEYGRQPTVSELIAAFNEEMRSRRADPRDRP